MSTLPWYATLILVLVFSVLVGLIIGAIINYNTPWAREVRAIKRRKKLRQWMRVANHEIDSAYRTSHFTVGRDAHRFTKGVHR